jgi:hypothetical protein
MVYIVEFIIMIILTGIYFNFILPYCLQQLLDDSFNNLINKNMIKNVTDYDIINYINASYLHENIVVIDKINYTNNNIYIYK